MRFEQECSAIPVWTACGFPHRYCVNPGRSHCDKPEFTQRAVREIPVQIPFCSAVWAFPFRMGPNRTPKGIGFVYRSIFTRTRENTRYWRNPTLCGLKIFHCCFPSIELLCPSAQRGWNLLLSFTTKYLLRLFIMRWCHWGGGGTAEGTQKTIRSDLRTHTDWSSLGGPVQSPDYRYLANSKPHCDNES